MLFRSLLPPGSYRIMNKRVSACFVLVPNVLATDKQMDISPRERDDEHERGPDAATNVREPVAVSRSNCGRAVCAIG